MHGSSVVLLSLFTSLATATGASYLIQRYDVFPSSQVEPPIVVPPLEGLSVKDARANAVAVDLALIVTGREAQAGARPGTVLRQSVATGQTVEHRTAVTVVVADVVPRVPEVVGLSLEAASSRLSAAGYEPKVGESLASAKEPEGIVLRQLPPAQSELVAGEQVELRASKGPAAVVVPKLSGMGRRKAERKLSQMGLRSKVRWISRAETVTHVVLSQKPGPGKKVEPGQSVEIVVNR